MSAEWGGNRVVVVLAGVAFKFPRIRLAGAWDTLKSHWRHKSFGREFEYTVYQVFSLKWLLFKGVVDNWKEYRFYRETRHPFLQPTYISLLGLVNIQKAGQPLGAAGKDIWHQFFELTDGAVVSDGHHFENPDNFSLTEDGLRILDYGGRDTQNLVREFGSKILNEFDPNYRYERGEER